MNEAAHFIVSIIVVGIIGISATVWRIRQHHAVRRTIPGTQSDAQRARELDERAADNNRQLTEAERAATGIIGQQEVDIGRAAEANRRAAALIDKARNILDSAHHSSNNN